MSEPCQCMELWLEGELDNMLQVCVYTGANFKCQVLFIEPGLEYLSSSARVEKQVLWHSRVLILEIHYFYINNLKTKACVVCGISSHQLYVSLLQAQKKVHLIQVGSD